MPYSKQTIIICITLGSLLLGAGIGTYYIVTKNANSVTEETRQIFSDSAGTVTYTDLAGNAVSLEQYLGKVLVVTSWASWSPFSSVDLQGQNTLASKYQGKEVVFLAINRKEVLSQAQRYAATLPELPNITLVIDTEDRFYTLVGGYAMPETVIFDKKGIIQEHIRGIFVSPTVETTIDSLLASEK